MIISMTLLVKLLCVLGKNYANYLGNKRSSDEKLEDRLDMSNIQGSKFYKLAFKNLSLHPCLSKPGSGFRLVLTQ